MGIEKVGSIVEKLKEEYNLQMLGFDQMSRKGYVLVPRFLFDLKISLAAKMVYALLLSYAWNKDFCFPGQDRLASDLRITRMTLSKHIKELKKSGLLHLIRRGRGQTNIYVLKLPSVDIKKK